MMDDISAMFANLGENYPGSRHKRRAVAPRRKAEPAVEAWDSKPTIAKVDGKEMEFFPIGAVAKAMRRKPNTIRDWLESGILPTESYRTSSHDPKRGSRRLWTREQIEGMIRIANEEGIFDGCNVNGTEFSIRVKELFRTLKEQQKAAQA